MKALMFRETGEPKSVLKLAEVPTPPLAGEALVRTVPSPITPSDLHMVRGRYGYQPELPASPGIEETALDIFLRATNVRSQLELRELLTVRRRVPRHDR